jgi:hypothetical protein
MLLSKSGDLHLSGTLSEAGPGGGGGLSIPSLLTAPAPSPSYESESSDSKISRTFAIGDNNLDYF